MKKGNVIATGVKESAVKGGAIKGTLLGRRAVKVLPSDSTVGVKGKTLANGGDDGKGESPAKEKAITKEKADAKGTIVEPKYLSVAQVALRWSSSEATVRRLMEEGKLNGIRLRHACRLSVESVDAYEASTHF